MSSSTAAALEFYDRLIEFGVELFELECHFVRILSQYRLGWWTNIVVMVSPDIVCKLVAQHHTDIPVQTEAIIRVCPDS